jgi:ankyrin repeat protein
MLTFASSAMGMTQTEFSYLPKEIKLVIADFFISGEPVATVAKNIVNYFSVNKQLRSVWDNPTFVNDLIDKLAYYQASRTRNLPDFLSAARYLPKVPTVQNAIKNHTELIMALLNGDIEKTKKLLAQKTSFDFVLQEAWRNKYYSQNYSMYAREISTLIKAGVNPDYQITPFTEPDRKVSLLALALIFFVESSARYPDLKELIKEIIKAGADVNAENPHQPGNYGKTLFDLAKESNDPEIIKLFEDAGAK